MMNHIYIYIYISIALISGIASAQTLPDTGKLKNEYLSYDFTINGINYEICRRATSDKIIVTDTVAVRQGNLIPADGGLIIPEKIEYGGKFYVVGEISPYAFDSRVDLKSVRLPESLTHIYFHAFFGCKNLETINIPSGVQKISTMSFTGCRKLHRLVFPASVNDIDVWSFGDSGLKHLELSENLRSFNGFATMGGAHHFDYILLGKNLQSITEVNAKTVECKSHTLKIKGNNKWKSFIVHSMTPFDPWVDGQKFKFAKDCTVYVPDEVTDAYRADSNWQVFKAIKPLSKYK